MRSASLASRSALLLAALVACASGSGNPGQPCTSYLDCPAGELCSGGFCAPTLRRSEAASGSGGSGASSGGGGSSGGGSTGAGRSTSAAASSAGASAASGSSVGGGPGGSSSGGSSAAGGASASSSGAATGSQGQGGSYAGEVVLEQMPYVAGTYDATAYAYFYAGSPIPSACAGQQSGNCCFVSSSGGSGGGDGGVLAPIGAGDIQLNGGSLGVLTFSPTAGYATLIGAETPSLQWNEGDTLTVTAPGATVDGFTGSVVAPAGFVGLSPPITASATTQAPLPSGEDFVLGWSPGGGTTVTVELLDEDGEAVTCSGPDSAGTLTVPAAEIALLAQGPGAIVLTRLTTATVSAGNAQVLLQASVAATAQAELGGGCGPQGWTCQTDADCCGENCTGGTCGCGKVGSSCLYSSDCCAGVCGEYPIGSAPVCQPVPPGSGCAQATDCGSQLCNDGSCVCASVGPSAVCFQDPDCCTGFCDALQTHTCLCAEKDEPCQTDADCCQSTAVCGTETECTTCGSAGKCCLNLGSSCFTSQAADCCSGNCLPTDGNPDFPTCQ